MKKYFFYAAAAIAMLASCQKNEMNNVQVVDDETPVAVSMKANQPVTGVVTKAAVNAWDNTKIYAFATKTLEGVTENVFAEKELTVASTGAIDLKDANDIPYYYAEKAVYDFYAYYKGDATFDGENGVYTVTFDGADDIMYAKADKTNDIPSPNPDGVTENDLYSAWAARRGAQPTLVFHHALTKFDFNIIGATDGGQSTTVRVDSIRIQSKNTGELTVVGTTQGLVVADVNAPAATDWLWLQNAAGEQELNVAVVEGEQPLDWSLMVAPGMTTVNVEVYMSNLVNGAYNKIQDPYTIPVNIDDVVFASAEVPTDSFAAGYAYTLKVKVYGPQEIVIDAELTDWIPGGSHEFDPDEDYRPGTAPAVVAAYDAAASAGADNVWNLTVADDVTLLYGGTSTTGNAADVTNWTALGLTKAQVATATFAKTAGNYLHIKYSTKADATEDDCTETVKPVAVPEVEEPEEVDVVKEFLYVIATEESYNQLPEAYRNHPDHNWAWEDYQWTMENNPTDADLPWLVLVLNNEYEGEEVSAVFTDPEGNTYENSATVGSIGMWSLNKSQMEVEEFAAGEWTAKVTIGEVTETVTVTVE